MKPFNLEKAKAGKKVCTREGFPVRIIDFNFKGHGKNKLIGVVKIDDSTEVAHVFTEEGINECNEKNQLFMVGEKHEGYVAIFKNPFYLNPNYRYVREIIWETEEIANNIYHDDKDLVAISKIEWDE